MMFTVFSTTAIYRLLNLDAYDAYIYSYKKLQIFKQLVLPGISILTCL